MPFIKHKLTLKSVEPPAEFSQERRVQHEIPQNEPLIYIQNSVDHNGKQQLDLIKERLILISQLLHSSVQKESLVGQNEQELDAVSPAPLCRTQLRTARMDVPVVRNQACAMGNVYEFRPKFKESMTTTFVEQKRSDKKLGRQSGVTGKEQRCVSQ